MVYVTPGESYNHAVDLARESFVELRNVERERIILEVNVVLKNQQLRRTAEIGRSAWPVVVATLARFEIVEIRVATEQPLKSLKAPAMTFSSSQSSSAPPPYASESLSQVSAAAPSVPAASGSAPRAGPDILTYSFASRMVYVTPGESHDHAVDIARESFIELRDVERERITLDVHVVLKSQQVRRTAEIGRTAWPVVVASLSRFEIIEIRVAAEPLKAPAMTFSSSQSSSSEPPPYASEKSRSQISSSQSSSPSLATRVVGLLTPKSSRNRLPP